MHAAAQELVGQHDFTSFRAKDCQAGSPVKTLDRLDVRRSGPEIHIDAVAQSFLHHQVRNFAGTLKLAGEESGGAMMWLKPSPLVTARRLEPTAPAEGLYLVEVAYGLDC